MLRRSELRAVSLWSAVLVALILIPYPFAGVFAGPGWHFMGHLHGVDDANAHLAWSRQAADGAWRLQNMYSPTPDKGLFFNAFFVGVGKAAALLHVEPIVAFHIARPICGWACLMSIYILAAFMFPDALTRWAAFALAGLSSGVGWLVHLIRTKTDLYPLDFGDGLIQPEAITFLSIYLNPLFAASVALMCLVFVTFLHGVNEGRWRWVVLAGVLNLVLGNIHTYDVLVVNGSLALYLVLLVASRAISLRNAACAYAIFVGVSVASPIYQAYITAVDPLYAAKAHTLTASGRVIDHALTYGFVLVLGLVGAGWVARRPDNRTVFLLAWLVLGALLPFAPLRFFAFQRKMWEGFHIVLCLLAAAGCTQVIVPWLFGRARGEPGPDLRRKGIAVVAVVVAITVPSNLFFVNMTMHHAADNNDSLIPKLMPPIYLSDDEARALVWLRDNTSREDIVFVGPFIGNHIPAVSGNRVFMGHWAETTRFSEAADLVRSFYSADAPPQWCERTLRAVGARYVYCGRHEWALSPDARPAFLEARNLAPAFESGEVSIYRVTDAPGDAER